MPPVPLTTVAVTLDAVLNVKPDGIVKIIVPACTSFATVAASVITGFAASAMKALLPGTVVSPGVVVEIAPNAVGAAIAVRSEASSAALVPMLNAFLRMFKVRTSLCG